jgi:hypothetical protein
MEKFYYIYSCNFKKLASASEIAVFLLFFIHLFLPAFLPQGFRTHPPIILETSRQAYYLIPMAISLGFGIIFATSIILVIVPCLYLVL